jgi:GNAT superfamily N-acetyltransferase
VNAQRYRVERLGRHHDRAAFSCGEEPLDAYLRERARQDANRHVATVFVLFDPETDRLAGYYTLSTSSVRLEDLPAETQRTLPRYPQAPVILLGRLAIDQTHQGQGLGQALLFNALRRAHDVGTEQIGATAVVVDALHDRARAFYEQYGCRRFPNEAYRLFLPMQTVRRLLREEGF